MTNEEILTHYELAVNWHQQGHLAEAEQAYRQILQLQPEHAESLHMLGVIAFQTGHLQQAIELTRQSLAINPLQVDAYSNLGLMLHNSQGYDEALACFAKALQIQPSFVNALSNQANLLKDLNRLQEALTSIDEVLAIQPDHDGSWNLRGTLLKELNRHPEALSSFQKALSINPANVDAINNRGTILQEQNRHQEALQVFQQALSLRQDFPATLNNQGYSLSCLNRLEESLASLDRALQFDPNMAEAHFNRATVLKRLERPNEALACFERCLELNPGHLVANHALSELLFIANRAKDTVIALSRLLEHAPDWPGAFGFKHNARMCDYDWSDCASNTQQILLKLHQDKYVIHPFPFLSVSESPEDQLQCAKIYCRDHQLSLSKPWKEKRYRHDRIRLAYLSPDFREHALSWLMMQIFETHDKRRFETVAVSLGPQTGKPIEERLRKAFDQFLDVKMQDSATIAKQLRNKEIDIAVDLAGPTSNSLPEIFPHRCAPIQVNYLGFPGTMGMSCMDYIIADEFVIPPENQQFYSENVVYLPDCFQANDNQKPISERVPKREQVGLPAKGLVFCSFNNSYKISPFMFDSWMRLLQQVPGSVLWLLSGSAFAKDNLRREAAHRGVDPDRLVFAFRLDYPDHLARMKLADLFLDTLPFNAGTTASDALWAGVPVLTCVGRAFASRMAGSLLRAVGLPELITENLADYEALAIKLATNPELLADIKSRLAKNRLTHALFDTDRFRRHLEAAYITMWERQQRGEPPVSFSVTPIA